MSWDSEIQRQLENDHLTPPDEKRDTRKKCSTCGLPLEIGNDLGYFIDGDIFCDVCIEKEVDAYKKQWETAFDDLDGSK
jgi:hypothetical protein